MPLKVTIAYNSKPNSLLQMFKYVKKSLIRSLKIGHSYKEIRKLVISMNVRTSTLV
jgi:hypothetical protein